MRYGAIQQRLMRQPKQPQARLVHHTEDEAKASLGIPRSGKLPSDVAQATERVESLRPLRHGKYTGKVFGAASSTQHSLMNRHLKNQKSEMQQKLKRKSDMLAEQLKEPAFESKRDDQKSEIRKLKKEMDALLERYNSMGVGNEE